MTIQTDLSYFQKIETCLLSYKNQTDAFYITTAHLGSVREGFPQITNQTTSSLVSCLDKNSNVITHYILLHQRETDTVEVFRVEGKLVKIETVLVPKINPLSHIIKTLTDRHSINRIWIDCDSFPFLSSSELSHITITFKSHLHQDINTVRKPAGVSENTLKNCQKTVEIADNALSHVQKTIESLKFGDTLTETQVFNLIKDQIDNHPDKKLISQFIQTTGYEPREADSNRRFSLESPVINCDISVTSEGQDDGYASLSRMFFYPEGWLMNQPETKKRYHQAKLLYTQSQNLVNYVSKVISVGDSGKEIYKLASRFFNQLVVPSLLEESIISEPMTLTESIGFWIYDGNKGNAFFRSTEQRLKLNDVLCIQCPIYFKHVDLAVNYKIQGVMTPGGFSSFVS